MIQMPSTVVVPGRSRMIVGREIRTMFESSKAMNVPIVVLVSTMYLYCIREPEARPRPAGIYLVESRAETERVGEEKTAMAPFACMSPLTRERLAVVLGMSAPNEISHAQAPFSYGFAGKPQKDAQTYMQHLALRTTDIEKLKSYLESKGAEFLTPIYKDKDSFGPLLQSFTRELFDDEWFFIEFVKRDYDADKVGPGGH